jgi:hypothetical protein
MNISCRNKNSDLCGEEKVWKEYVNRFRMKFVVSIDGPRCYYTKLVALAIISICSKNVATAFLPPFSGDETCVAGECEAVSEYDSNRLLILLPVPIT